MPRRVRGGARVSQSVVPGVDEDELMLTGTNDAEVEQIAEVLLASHTRRDLWSGHFRGQSWALVASRLSWSWFYPSRTLGGGSRAGSIPL
jgi:hypothetical protein